MPVNLSKNPSKFLFEDKLEENDSALDYIKNKILNRKKNKPSEILNFTNPVKPFQAIKSGSSEKFELNPNINENQQNKNENKVNKNKYLTSNIEVL
jgi:hypothetical protein